MTTAAVPAQPFRLERSIPLALVVALAIQTAGALIWTGRAGARIEALEQRIESQASVAERLARLEEQSLANRAALERIEQKLEDRR